MVQAAVAPRGAAGAADDQHGRVVAALQDRGRAHGGGLYR
jgi:hypothetical protein